MLSTNRQLQLTRYPRTSSQHEVPCLRHPDYLDAVRKRRLIFVVMVSVYNHIETKCIGHLPAIAGHDGCRSQLLRLVRDGIKAETLGIEDSYVLVKGHPMFRTAKTFPYKFVYPLRRWQLPDVALQPNHSLHQ